MLLQSKINAQPPARRASLFSFLFVFILQIQLFQSETKVPDQQIRILENRKSGFFI